MFIYLHVYFVSVDTVVYMTGIKSALLRHASLLYVYQWWDSHLLIIHGPEMLMRTKPSETEWGSAHADSITAHIMGSHTLISTLTEIWAAITMWSNPSQNLTLSVKNQNQESRRGISQILKGKTFIRSIVITYWFWFHLNCHWQSIYTW